MSHCETAYINAVSTSVFVGTLIENLFWTWGPVFVDGLAPKQCIFDMQCQKNNFPHFTRKERRFVSPSNSAQVCVCV